MNRAVVLALLFIAVVARAKRSPFLTTGPFATSSAPSTAPKPTAAALPPYIAKMIGQMAQYDIQAFVIPVPSNATVENPTFDGITYPTAAIEYGLWFNESQVAQLIADNNVGSLFNSPVSGSDMQPPNAHWWRALQDRLYNMSAASNPILYGLDNVHGVNYAFGATIFPQAIGTAATFDRSCAFNVGNITSRESRYLGIPWSFAPILGIAVQPSWPRVYETFGEDPVLSSEMGVADITGMQLPPPASMFPSLCSKGSPLCPQVAVAACMKHFIGYSNARTGRDRTPAWIPDNFLMQYFYPSFEAAVKKANVLSAMENYIQVNGQPVVSSKLYLQFLLRKVLKFQGMLVTDYNEIYMLHDFHNATGSYKDSVALAINQTTIDMGMFQSPYGWDGGTFTDNLAQVFKENIVSESRISDSNTRIGNLKGMLGLFQGSPVPPEQSMPLDSYKNNNATPAGQTCFFGCPEHHAVALDAARKSMTLLQNDGILPLAPSKTTKIAVVGKACNSIPILAGGWTVHWQGSHNPSDYPYGLTVLQELSNSFESLTFDEGCNITERSVCGTDTLTAAVAHAKAADFVVVCVGESQYAEVVGDISDLTLPGQQIAMVEQLAAANKNIITVLVEGRPRVLGTLPSLSRAVLMAYLPGPFGGQAIGETLVGLNNPGGRLPISYPKHLSEGPVQYWRSYSANEFNDYDLQWTFGSGLSYTKFNYTNVRVGWQNAEDIAVTLNVTNVGSVAGSDVVLVFTTQAPRPMPAEVKRLRNFTRVYLYPGETQEVTIYFSITSLKFHDQVNCEWIAICPTFVTVGEADPFVVEGLTKQVDFGHVTKMAFLGCPWTEWYAEQSFGVQIATGAPSTPSPEGETKDYFMSSIVCFVGGVIATCFLVFFVRKRNRYLRTDHVQLFEPSGV